MPKVLTNNGFKSYDDVLVTLDKKEKIKLTFSNNKELCCSLDHKLYNGTSFVEACNIQTGDCVNTISGEVTVSSIEYYKDEEFVYDLVNVEDTHAYYTNGVLSHNCVFIDECIGGDTMITVRNKVTGEIKEVSMEDFWGLCK